MKLKKKWVCIVFLLVLSAITVSAQTGLYELQRGAWLLDSADASTDETLVSAWSIGLSGGGGVLKRFERAGFPNLVNLWES